MKHTVFARRLATALRTNSSLTSLALGDCGLDDADTALLAEALAVNTTLLSLSLPGNLIKDRGEPPQRTYK